MERADTTNITCFCKLILLSIKNLGVVKIAFKSVVVVVVIVVCCCRCCCLSGRIMKDCEQK